MIPEIRYGARTAYGKNGREITYVIEERSGMGPLITFGDGGVIDIVPPIPTNPEWWERIRTNWSRTAYEEAARISREKQANG